MDDVITFTRNLGYQFDYAMSATFTSHDGIMDAEKMVEQRWDEDKKDPNVHYPKFQNLRGLYMDLCNPTTGKPLIEAIIPVPGDSGRQQLMFVNKDDNGEYLSRIKAETAGWWWNRMRTDRGFTDACARKFMRCFTTESRFTAEHCTVDPDTWIVTNSMGSTKKSFAELVEADLSDVEEDEVVKDAPIVIDGSAKEELQRTMKYNENFEFNKGGGGASRASTFAGSVGNSTNRSVNSKRMAVQKTVNKELEKENREMQKQMEEKEEKMAQLQARIREMEAMAASQPTGSNMQGSPHLSGGSAAGVTPGDQNAGQSGCAAEQG